MTVHTTCILGIQDLTNIRCGNLNLNKKQDFSAAQEAGFTNI